MQFCIHCFQITAVFIFVVRIQRLAFVGVQLFPFVGKEALVVIIVFQLILGGLFGLSSPFFHQSRQHSIVLRHIRIVLTDTTINEGVGLFGIL